MAWQCPPLRLPGSCRSRSSRDARHVAVATLPGGRSGGIAHPPLTDIRWPQCKLHEVSSESVVPLGGPESNHPAMAIKCKLHLYVAEDPEWPYVRKTRGDRGFRTVLDVLRIALTERVSRVVLPFRPPSALDEVN